MNNKLHTFLFLLLVILVSIYFQYPKVFNLAPQGAHAWRQTDGCSFALNYFQDGLDFFQPRVHYSSPHDGKTVGEFPGIYYLVAIIYKIFGENTGLFRLLTFSFFVAGLLGLSKILRSLLQDDLISLLLPLLFWSSPIITFYAFNFLPNVPALGLVLVGWYFIYQYYFNNKTNAWHVAMFVFLFAGLIKLTVLTNLIAIAAIWFWTIFKEKKQLVYEVRKNRKLIVSFLLVFCLNALWLLWAKRYNELNGFPLFLATIKPIWTMKGVDINHLFNVNVLQKSHIYFHYLTHTLVILSAIFIIFKAKKLGVFFSLFLLTLGAVISVLALWYKQFDIHYYYAIEYMVFPIVTFVSILFYFKKYHPKLIVNLFFRIAFIAFISLNLYHARDQMINRYYDETDGIYRPVFSEEVYQIKELRTFIRSLGIKPEDKVLALPDYSPNTLLYYLNQKGYSGYARGDLKLSDKRAKWLVNEKGVKYLIICKKYYLDGQPAKEVLKHPLGVYKDAVFVYDLRPFQEK